MNWFSVINKFLPSVIQGVVAVEAVLSHAPGATKKQIVLDAIQAGVQVGQGVPIPEVQGVAALIDTVVASLNAAGVFAKKPTPPTV